MQVRLPRIDYSQVRPDWAPNREFAHDRNASSTIPSYVEPYLIEVMKRARAVLPESETQLRAEIDWFIAQEAQHFRQHNGFNRRIRQSYPGIEPFERELEATYVTFLAERSLKFNLAYSEGFESLGPPAAKLWFEHSDAMLEGAQPEAVALWKWHMAEEFEHRTVCYRLFRALYARTPWGRFWNGWLYRLYGFVGAVRHLGGYTKRLRTHLIDCDRAGMSEEERAQSSRNLQAVSELARRHMLPEMLKVLSPFYDPGRKQAPRGLTAYLARFEKGGDMGLGDRPGRAALTAAAPVRPFRIEVAQPVLDRIQARLALSEVGYAPADDADWSYGTDARWLTELLDHWRERYDWRAAEAALNRWPQFRAEVDGFDIHFLHIRPEGEARMALVLTHGWPGSILEFDAAIAPLVAQGFELVIPSLPGFGFSSRPQVPIGPRRVAALWRKLMVEVLGHDRFGAQGGDWGSAVTTWLGRDHGDVVAAIHLNLFLAPGDSTGDDAATAAWRQEMQAVQARESAYMMQHATKPQTIGLALAGNPLGFAAWVVEKFHGWGDTHGDIESRFSKDQLLTNIMIYLVNDAVQSAIWTYRTIFTEPRDGPRVAVPTGLALFPAEFLPYPPRSAAERGYNVARWTEMQAGGHFAAMEEPNAFAAEIGSFFAEVAAVR